MIWYVLFFGFVVLIIAAIADAENTNPALCWIVGFIVGGIFVAGLVIQWGVLR